MNLGINQSTTISSFPADLQVRTRLSLVLTRVYPVVSITVGTKFDQTIARFGIKHACTLRWIRVPLLVSHKSGGNRCFIIFYPVLHITPTTRGTLPHTTIPPRSCPCDGVFTRYTSARFAETRSEQPLAQQNRGSTKGLWDSTYVQADVS